MHRSAALVFATIFGNIWTVIVWIVAGGIAGAITDRIVQGNRLGCLGNVAVGVIGWFTFGPGSDVSIPGVQAHVLPPTVTVAQSRTPPKVGTSVALGMPRAEQGDEVHELGMDAGAVQALVVVLDDDLPVRGDLVVDAMADAEGLDAPSTVPIRVALGIGSEVVVERSPWVRARRLRPQALRGGRQGD